jgi:hypothetical protein
MCRPLVDVHDGGTIVMHVAQGDLLEASLAGRGADVHFHLPSPRRAANNAVKMSGEEQRA